VNLIEVHCKHVQNFIMEAFILCKHIMHTNQHILNIKLANTSTLLLTDPLYSFQWLESVPLYGIS
jgi:hypothetical protein